MGLGIVDLTIKGFRNFRELRVEGLGRVNLITGCNNTGKSSLLEALRILVSDFPPEMIVSILAHREEDISDVEEPDRQGYIEPILQISTLFHGYPELPEPWEPILITADGDRRPRKVTLKLGSLTRERAENGTRRYAPSQMSLFDEEDPISVSLDAIPALIFNTSDSEESVSLERLWRHAYRQRRMGSEFRRSKSNSPCIYVSPYGGESTAELGTLWDEIALSDLESQVVAALRIIDPSISAVSMVGGDRSKHSRTAIVRSDKIPRPLPLRSFGDGLNRLFGIVLSLANAEGGLLLIDEFENGMHYSVQLDAWRMIFRLAEKLGVQVFATSHSWDAVEAFQQAAAETPEEGVLVRLARKGEDIIPTLFREDELKIITRDRIEVR